MKKFAITLGLILMYWSSIGQEIHSPAEIFEILEKSPVTYELNALEGEISPPDRSSKLNYNHYYRLVDADGISTYPYQVKDEIKELLSNAEEHFFEKEFSSARNMYLKVLDVDPTYYQVMTYIGQIYGIEGDFDTAIEWYTKAITVNYIDYMAHWFLADAYKIRGEIDKAVDEITIAIILNRNNPRIKNLLDEIYGMKKLKTADWVFNPQMDIDSIGANRVRVAFNSDWLGYAMVKALWMYEPNYKESMGVKDGAFSTIEEKEAFVSLMANMNKKKLKKYPELKALQLALDKQMIDEYIFYEIVLIDHPFVAYQLSEEMVHDIKDYVVQVRGVQK